MILSIVIALVIFFFGIPLAIWLFVLTVKAIGAAFHFIVETFFGACFAILDAVAWAIKQTLRAIRWAYRGVRAQVQNLG